MDSIEIKTKTAPDFLKAAMQHMEDRAKTYDKPEGERSMEAIVKAFLAVTGVEMTTEQGWLFMAILKMVRSQQGQLKLDNYEDGAAYMALAGETAAVDRRVEPILKSGSITRAHLSVNPHPQHEIKQP